MPCGIIYQLATRYPIQGPLQTCHAHATVEQRGLAQEIIVQIITNFKQSWTVVNVFPGGSLKKFQMWEVCQKLSNKRELLRHAKRVLKEECKG